MTDRGILVAIGEQCDAEIRFFDLVELHYLQRTRKLFMCVGKHGASSFNKRYVGGFAI